MDTYPIWHPFTSLQSPPPIEIVSGRGALLFDKNQKSYLDAIASWWVNLHGHAHPYIAQKVFEQLNTLEHVIFAGFTHQPALQLSQALLAILPANFEKIFFSDNGSTAVEVALKMAVQYAFNQGEQKNTFLALENAYHGDTFGAMAVGERNAFSAPFQEMLFRVVHIPVPTEENLPQIFEKINQLQKNTPLAGFIYEPLVQGAGGMNMYTPEALNSLLQFCQKNNILCIADEVMTGFGRTGKMLASDYCSTPPDLVCLSKGITGGTMALGVTACSEKIVSAFRNSDSAYTFFHGHSYTANPTACAAALASMDLLIQAETQAAIRQISTWHKEFIGEIAAHPRVKNARTCGTIAAFELVSDEADGYFNTKRRQIEVYFLERGILLRPLGNTIYFMPPYCINLVQIQQLYRGVKGFLSNSILAA
ncbi:MAG: adenosylmethionine--8-amino-7-oxononanoate transaminase [Chitinophagales bacterium]